MASITWSTSLSSGTYAGTNWTSYNLSGGSPLPTNAVITNVEYSVTAYIGKYTSKSGKFNFYAIAVNNGPYTTSSYDSGSATTLTGTISAVTSSNGSESSATTYSFQSGSAKVWRYNNQRTYLRLVDCDFSSNQSTPSAFSSSNISVKVRLNSSLSGTTYITAISVTVNYVVPYLSWGGTLSAYQSNNQVVLNWSATPSYGNGTGACTYSVHNGTTWVKYDLPVSTRSYTLTPTSYGGNITYKVAALYHGGLLYEEKTVTFAAKPPSLSWNNAAPTVTENADGTLTISWNAGSGSWGASGTVVKYTLYAASSSSSSGTAVGTYTGTSVTITGPANDTYYYVTAVYSSASSTSGRTAYAAHRTVKRWNGSAWEECIVYCYQNGTWVECIPYIYNGSGWELLSH